MASISLPETSVSAARKASECFSIIFEKNGTVVASVAVRPFSGSRNVLRIPLAVVRFACTIIQDMRTSAQPLIETLWPRARRRVLGLLLAHPDEAWHLRDIARLIREVHRGLLREVRGAERRPGEFRTSQNWIGAAGCDLTEATYIPPPVPEMKEALGAWESYLHAKPENPPLIWLAFIHYQFEAIHPFIDGNGRIGRLLLSLLTVNWGLLPHPLLYLSSYFERHRDAYYDHLLAVSAQGAWRGWVDFFLQGVAVEARDAVTRIGRLQDLQAEWRELLARPRTSATLLRLLDHLFATPIITIPSAQKVLGMTYRTAKLHVDRLVDEGGPRQIGEGSHGKVYVAIEIMTIIHGDIG